MSTNESELRAELALSEEKLSVRTRELDQAEIALDVSEHELEDIQSEFSAFTTQLANLTSKLSRASRKLDASNAELVKRTEELLASNEELATLTYEKDCFVAVLRNLSNPIVGNTKILEYIAAGKSSPEKQPELLKRMIGFNASLLTETDRLTAAFLELSERPNQLDAHNDLTTDIEALGEANAQLKAMKSIMQQREDFVAALTHDLKNPLIGCSRILQLIVDGAITIEQRPELLSQIIESHKNMLHLIRNMLEVYRSDTGCLTPIRESVDLGALARQCAGEFSFAIREKKIEFFVDSPEPPLVVTTDRDLLRRVLMNLLDNGVKFTPESGQLSVTMSQGEHQVRLSVKNSGTGITESERLQIFDRFWQTPRGREYGVGTGLGLFLARQIMEAMGGRLECFSTENIETVFIVVLDTVEPV